jgi:hypothetical protein
MAIYRYRLESIDPLTRKTRRHHRFGLAIFIAAVSVAGLAIFPFPASLVVNLIFILVVLTIYVSTSRQAYQRVANLFRSAEIEIDNENASSRSDVRKTSINRSEIAEAWFSPQGIWLRDKRNRFRLQFPAELEGFDKLPGLLEEWLPQDVVRRNATPSTSWTYLRMYGTWATAAVLLYLALASDRRAIALPACVVTGVGVAWYFAWCGRIIRERKWKVLLPLSGWVFGGVLLVRAFLLWATR